MNKDETIKALKEAIDVDSETLIEGMHEKVIPNFRLNIKESVFQIISSEHYMKLKTLVYFTEKGIKSYIEKKARFNASKNP